VDARGEVVGINAMIVGGDQSVAIAASVVTDFMKKAIQKAGPVPADVI
jgi:S1-C subfamily serine protease